MASYIDGFFGALIFFCVLQWVTALGRCAIRIFIVRKFGLDDVAMLITLLLATAYDGCYFAIQQLTKGGQPIWEINIKDLFKAENVTLALLVTYILGTMMLKVALGLLLLRVLVKRWQVMTIYVCVGISVVFSLFYFFFVLFECGPPHKFSTKIIAGQCLSKRTIDGTGYAHGILIATTDCVFAVLPIALIRQTDMSKRSKISVALILSLGSVGCICTFVRLAYIHLLSKATYTYFHTAKPIGLLSGAELSIGITCLSLSCYKPLFRKFFWRQETYYYDTNTTGGAHGWHAAHRHSQPLQNLDSYNNKASPFSDPASRRGPLTSNQRRTSSKMERDWPMKSPKYSEDAESAITSPVSPVKGL